MSIHDQDNITLLIGILETEFNRQSVRRPNFVDFFNNKLKNYHERRFNYRDLQDMNKNLLSDCFQYISNQNREIEKNTMVLKPPPSSHTFQTPSDNIHQQKSQQKSNSSFDSYKQQYDTMLNPKKPSDIDFSDTIEDEPIQNLDSIINQTLEDRAKELQRITTTYNDKPPDWIKPSTQDTPSINSTNNINNNNEPMKLIIEDDEKPNQTSLPNSILKTKQTSNKKVTFNMQPQIPIQSSRQQLKKSPTINNLLNKLKLKQSDIPAPPTLSDNQPTDIEKRIYDKIEAKVEAKFAILNEKYNKLQIQYEELSMKYGELSIPSLPQHQTRETDKID
jgi:hypothetical protein